MAIAAGSDRLHARFPDVRERLLREVHRKVVGLDEIIDLLLVGVLSGGHCLLVGVPGLAKTLLVRSISELLDLRFSRIQFTPDLMPSDIVGAEVIAEDTATGVRDFRFMPGPVFANILLADEINRTPPKTQAALMEAMEERQITVGGRRHALERPFFVLATQNPIEQEGTYPLPAAQLDRFLFLVKVDYPPRDQEREIVRLTAATAEPEVRPVVGRDELLSLMDHVARAQAPAAVTAHATTLARRTRPDEPSAPESVRKYVSYGAGPRGAQSLVHAAKVRALLLGREQPSVEDINALVRPTFRHRLVLNFKGEAEGVTPETVLSDVLGETPAAAPKRRGLFRMRREQKPERT